MSKGQVSIRGKPEVELTHTRSARYAPQACAAGHPPTAYFRNNAGFAHNRSRSTVNQQQGRLEFAVMFEEDVVTLLRGPVEQLYVTAELPRSSLPCAALRPLGPAGGSP
jgi:hypothetical protein